MAKNKSRIDIPNIGMIEGNWATEETLNEILELLEDSMKKKKSGGGKSSNGPPGETPAEKRARKAREDAEKRRRESEEESTKILDKFGNSLGRSVANINRFSTKVGSSLKGLDGIGSSAKSMTDGLLGIVGGMGMLGGVIGFVAATLDEMAEAQVRAIQSGFALGEGFEEIKTGFAKIGMDMGEFSTLLADNGEAIRALGGNATDAATGFSKLVMKTMEETEAMGHYGMTSVELAEEMAAVSSKLVAGGLAGEALAAATAKNFKLMNNEVTAMARLTGKNRRDIMRNDQSIGDDTMAQAAIEREFGAGSTMAMEQLIRSVTSPLGEGSEVIADLLVKSAQTMAVGRDMFTEEQQALLSSIPGMRGMLDKASAALADAGGDLEVMAKQSPGLAAEFMQFMKNNEEFFYQQSQMLAGGAMDATAQMLAKLENATRTAGQGGKNILDPDAVEEAYTPLDKATADLLGFSQEMEVVEQNIKNLPFQALGTDMQEFMASLDFDKVNGFITGFGDTISGFREGVNGIFGDGAGIAAMVTGIGALWAAPAVVGALAGSVASFFGKKLMTMVGSALGLGGNDLDDLLGDLSDGNHRNNRGGNSRGGKGKRGLLGRAANMVGGLAGEGSLLTKAGRLAKVGAKAVPYLGSALGAGMGFFDSEYKDAGYSGIDRAGLGLVEGTLDFGDMIGNILTLGLADIDMSGAFKDFATGTGRDFLQAWTAETSEQRRIVRGTNDIMPVPEEQVEPMPPTPPAPVAATPPDPQDPIVTPPQPQNQLEALISGFDRLARSQERIISELARTRRVIEENS